MIPSQSILTFCADQHLELEKKLTQTKEYLSTKNSLDLPLNTCCDSVNHNHKPIRLAVIGKSPEEILQKLIAGHYHVTPKTSSIRKPKLCFQYTGQGAQFHRMGEGLYASFPVYRKEFNKCTDFFKRTYGLDLSRIPPDLESKSTFLQKAYGLLPTLCLQYGLFKLWESWNIKPDTILTHSLGEYAAAVQCGYISFEVAATVLTEECRYFELLLSDGRMLVIQQSPEGATNLIKRLEDSQDKITSQVEIALNNSPSQVVVSGKLESIEKFQSICEEEGIRCRKIPVSLAYHSKLMRPVYQHCLNKTESLIFADKPKNDLAYISGMTGTMLKDGEMCASYWCDHFTSPVNFQAACFTAIQEKCDFFLEIGPRPVLSSFVHEVFNYRKMKGEISPACEINCLPSIKPDVDECSTILHSLAELFVNGWNVTCPMIETI